MKKIIFIALFLVLLIIGMSFFYLREQAYFSHGPQRENMIFEVNKGEGVSQIGKNLAEKGIIKNKLCFLAYMALSRNTKAIFPGEYLLSGNMSIPEILVVITNSKKAYEKVLFKEGWVSKQLAEELDKHGFSGKEFLEQVNKPSGDIVSQFEILSDKPQNASLEGYLFPDTYYFSKEATAEGIIKKILNNTEQKINLGLREEIKKQNRKIFDVIILASIVEKEMANSSEAKSIAGVFQNRLQSDMLLQSDAPLTYILGDNEDQHSSKDLELDSPYNTYKYKGLPPGPISNPGLDALMASINPQKNDYYFFLTVKEGGKIRTIFSKNFQEHVANRGKYGL